MRVNENKEVIKGRIYQHSLALKESGPNSKNPGTKYIAGNLEIAVDEEGINVIPVHFTYVTATYAKSGKKNDTFDVLTKIIDSGSTWIENGKDAATLVEVSGSLALNDFINRDDELISAKVNEGSFVNFITVDKLGEESKRNTWRADMLINNVQVVEANEEKHIDNDYVVVKGAVFNFRNELLPMEFVVRTEGGMKYFEDLGVSPKEPVYTKVWGRINCTTSKSEVVEDTAFGEAAVRTYERKTKEWTITGAAKVPYDFGDEKVMTAEELTAAMQARQTVIADVRKRNEEYKASQNAVATSAATTTDVTAGGFSF